MNRIEFNHPHPLNIIHEETLRDGLQSPENLHLPSPEETVELFHRAYLIGTTSADIGFPGAGQTNFERCLAVAQFNTTLAPQVDLSCAARMNLQDIEPVSRLSQITGIPIRVDAFIGTDPLRIKAQGWTHEDMLGWVESAMKFSRDNNLQVMIVTETTFEGIRKHPQFIQDIYLAALDRGANRVCLCDTTGSETPDSVMAGILWMRKILDRQGYSHIPIDFHGHNDLGLAAANTLAAIKVGADKGHVTILGLGERGGNTDRTTMQLILRKTLIDQGMYDLTKLKDYVNAACSIFGIPIPYKYPGLGKHATAQVSGVHAHATLQALNNLDPQEAAGVYLPMDLGSTLGLDQTHTTTIGTMAGKANIILYARLHQLPKPTDEQTLKVLTYAKTQDRNLTHDEICAILLS